MAPSLDSPTSPLTSTQCVQNPTTTTTGTNNVTSLASPISLATPPNIPASLSSNNNQTVLTNNFDLQEILSQFGTQPDLLKIILTSKVEEDKRRAEEAKLRVREIDLMLLDRYRQRRFAEHVEDIHGNSLGTYLTPDGPSSTYALFNNNLASSIQNIPIDNNAISSSYNHAKCIAHCGLNGTPSKRKRKRREMLPVTMIIETKDNPYKDAYLWKNNGNTTQRKTGNKSVYYKCSNSNKGCPVNKTVTEKEDGWMIKYRGHHLEDCGKIKRIVQS
ncbi:15043_t:CDS:2 [Entrophospora sp. SA101]|nr:15043_t:CDS:2 [Entrophospora sp. SA101]